MQCTHENFSNSEKNIDSVYCKVFIIHERNVMNLMNPGTFVNILLLFLFRSNCHGLLYKISLESA